MSADRPALHVSRQWSHTLCVLLCLRLSLSTVFPGSIHVVASVMASPLFRAEWCSHVWRDHIWLSICMWVGVCVISVFWLVQMCCYLCPRVCTFLCEHIFSLLGRGWCLGAESLGHVVTVCSRTCQKTVSHGSCAVFCFYQPWMRACFSQPRQPCVLSVFLAVAVLMGWGIILWARLPFSS